MESILREIPALTVLCLALYAQRALGRSFSARFGPAWTPRFEWGARLGAGLMVAAYSLAFYPIRHAVPLWQIPAWIRGAGHVWAFVSIIAFALDRVAAGLAIPVLPERRRLLRGAADLAMTAPVAALGYGLFIGRHQMETREVTVKVKGLPKDLDGLRLAQITDIHLSPFFSPRDLDRAIDMANEGRPHITLLTGDLITDRKDPLDICLERLTKLKAEAGVFGCMGNHERYSECEDYVASRGARTGIRFLRQDRAELRFGSARLNITGVDYQQFRKPYLTAVEGTDHGEGLSVLLSHNPDVFHRAVELGYDLTIAGHTHGGQITVEYLHQHLNLTRFYTPYVYGLYEKEGRSLYVSRGLGTVGMPVRLGAPPEVALIRLCAT